MKALSNTAFEAWNRMAKIGMVIVVMNLLSISLMATDVDEELSLERWMSTPFDVSMEETDIGVEHWMTTPFSAEVDNSPVYGSETDTRP